MRTTTILSAGALVACCAAIYGCHGHGQEGAAVPVTPVAADIRAASPGGETPAPATPAAPATPGNRWGLLIGIDDYTHLGKLSFCGADMRELEHRLCHGGFPAEHIYRLDDHARDTAKRPTKSSIENELQLVLSNVQPGDLLLVAFSGHGIESGGASFLCPQDATIDDVRTMILLDDPQRATGIFRQLYDSRATHKVLLVNACRNNLRPSNQKAPGDPGDTNRFSLAVQNAPPGMALLTSCSPGEYSREDTVLGHGVFMNFVLQCLYNGYVEKRKIGMLELCLFVDDKTKNHVAQKYHEQQHPYYKIDGPDFPVTESPGRGPDHGFVPPGTPPPPPGPATKTNNIGMKLALIPAGLFRIGAPDADKDRSANERPPHDVRITRPFYIGANKVTREQFQQFVTEIGHETAAEKETGLLTFLGKKTWRDPGFLPSGQDPVVCVTYDDATAFCGWLTSREGKTYRLPTEAEWEYAARAGTESKFFFGNEEKDLAKNAWFFGNATKATTQPVGLMPANKWGLCDVCGNAMEWCSDWYDKSWYASSPKDDPLGPIAGTDRVIRGAWFHARTAEQCRVSKRSHCLPSTHLNGLGFRVIEQIPLGSDLNPAEEHPAAEKK